MPSATWIHLVGSGRRACLRCAHCGEEVPFPYGLVTWVTAYNRAFTAAHRDCLPGEKPIGRTRLAYQRAARPQPEEPEGA